jgi:glycosyltransferase involved in cell wall biosynthesis
MDLKLKLVTTALDIKGGANRVVIKIAKHFDAPIYCRRYVPESTFEEFRNLDVIVPKESKLDSIPIGKNMLKTIESTNYFYNLKLEDYDVVNAHISPSEWVRNRNSPVLWYCYVPYRFAFDLYKWKTKDMGIRRRIPFEAWIATFKYLENKTVPDIEYIFSVSKNSQGRIKRYLNRDSEVLYPGIETHKFSCKAYENFFFYPSRIDTTKQFEYAIEAFRIFSKKRKGWKFVIVGSLAGFFRDYLKRLEAMCDDSIIIETDVSEERILDLYSRCYAMLFSAVDEDLGLVPLEALASSKPVIARNEGGPRETVSDGVDGFLVNSPSEMAEKMEWLAQNPDVCEKMGRAGKEKVNKYFTWDYFLKRFEEKAVELCEKQK